MFNMHGWRKYLKQLMLKIKSNISLDNSLKILDLLLKIFEIFNRFK